MTHKIEFFRKIELYEGKQLHYTAECKTKEEAALIRDAWKIRGKTNVKIKRYKESKFRKQKHLVNSKLYKADKMLWDLWLPAVVAYYIKAHWLANVKGKVIEVEYIHHRWPTDYYEKKTVIAKSVKTIKGL